MEAGNIFKYIYPADNRDSILKKIVEFFENPQPYRSLAVKNRNVGRKYNKLMGENNV